MASGRHHFAGFSLDPAERRLFAGARLSRPSWATGARSSAAGRTPRRGPCFRGIADASRSMWTGVSRRRRPEAGPASPGRQVEEIAPPGRPRNNWVTHAL
jgi:hypothetical protein